MDQERFRDLSAEFLVSGLREPELSDFQAELERRGESGQSELARMREAIAALALVAPAATPSPELKRRLLARLEPAAAELIPGPIPRAEQVIAPAGRPWEWILAAAVAAALAALLTLWNVQTRKELARTEDELARVKGELTLIASPRGRAHTLVGTPEQPRAIARVFIDPTTGRALLFAFDLPILAPDKVYQLWAIKGQTPVAVATFSTGSDHRARVELENPQVLEGADVLAVTVEPAPGVPKPTGKMVLASS